MSAFLSLDAPRVPYGLHAGLRVDIERGRVVGLVGPNGAGKTTLIRCLSGELSADRVQLEGRPLSRDDARSRARRIAVLRQEEPRPEGFTARAVVELGRLPHLPRWGGPRAADLAAVDRAMADTDVTALAERRVETLSGGEYQRVRIARALAQSPSLLLLDEPEAHLDLGHRTALLALLSRINRKTGLTVVAALHALDVAALYCDRVILMDAGRAVASGPPAEVFTAERLTATYGVPVWVEGGPDGLRLGPGRLDLGGDS